MKKFLLLSGLFLVTQVFADNFKMGYVDVGKIFTTTKQAIALQNALKTKFNPQQNQLKTMNDNLVKEQSQINAIEAKAGSPDKLSVDNKAKLTKLLSQYQKDQLAFQQKYSIFQQNMQKYQDYASAILLGKVNTILKSISDAGNYDLVLTSNQLVYAKPKYDLTDIVIEKLKAVDSDSLVKQLQNADKLQNPAQLKQLISPK
ncbi:MAG: OmpH family outer membrane protein [Neisseriaceae bacterium]